MNEGAMDEPDSRIHRTGNDLRIALLTLNVRDGRRVTGENVHLGFRSHIPHLSIS